MTDRPLSDDEREARRPPHPVDSMNLLHGDVTDRPKEHERCKCGKYALERWCGTYADHLGIHRRDGCKDDEAKGAEAMTPEQAIERLCRDGLIVADERQAIVDVVRGLRERLDVAESSRSDWEGRYRACMRKVDETTAERDAARAALAEALEYADDLRVYTHDWDWKYGEEWDKARAALGARAAVEGEKKTKEETT